MGYLDPNATKGIFEQCNEIARMLSGLLPVLEKH